MSKDYREFVRVAGAEARAATTKYVEMAGTSDELCMASMKLFDIIEDFQDDNFLRAACELLEYSSHLYVLMFKRYMKIFEVAGARYTRTCTSIRTIQPNKSPIIPSRGWFLDTQELLGRMKMISEECYGALQQLNEEK